MWLQQEKYMVTKLFVCALKKRGWDMWMCLFSRRSEQALNSASEPVNSPCTVLWFTLLQPVARGYRVRWKVFFFSLYVRCWRRSDDCITGISSCVFIPAADSNCGLFTRGQLIFGTDIHLPGKNKLFKQPVLKVQYTQVLFFLSTTYIWYMYLLCRFRWFSVYRISIVVRYCQSSMIKISLFYWQSDWKISDTN